MNEYFTIDKSGKYMLLVNFCRLLRVAPRIGAYWIEKGLPHIRDNSHYLIDIIAGVKWVLDRKYKCDTRDYVMMCGMPETVCDPIAQEPIKNLAVHHKRKYGKHEYSKRFQKLWNLYHDATKVKKNQKPYSFKVYAEILESGISFQSISKYIEKIYSDAKVSNKADGRPFFIVLNRLKKHGK